MKKTGKRSVVKLLDFWVKFCWAGALVFLCLLLPAFLVFHFLGTPATMINLPVHLNAAGIINTVDLAMEQGALLFTDFKTSYIPASVDDGFNYRLFLMVLLQSSIAALILYRLTLLKRITNNLMKDQPFAEENGLNLKKISWLVMAGTPVSYIYHWLAAWYFTNHTEMPFEVYFHRGFNPDYIIAGLVLLVVAEIFNQAAKIYEEQKFTV